MVLSLPRSTPEAQGVRSSDLQGFVEAVDRLVDEPHSVMVVRRGKVIAEAWWHPYTADRRHLLFSLTKSFTSTAVGLAVGEGLLDLDDPVVKFFPGVAPARPSRYLAALKVRHLLTMTTGRLTDSMEEAGADRSGDWVRGFFRRPWLQAPGAPFVYDTGASHVLGAIVTQVSGLDLAEFLKPRLFDPLGITDFTWETEPQGRRTGGFGLSLRTEDVAKFGQLLLQRGVWEGRQLLPAGWVDLATSLQTPNDEFAPAGNPDWRQGYGFQFWRGRHGSYRGDGAFGQYCVVLADQETVVAATAATPDMQPFLDVVWNRLLPILGDAPLAEAPGDRRALEAAQGALRLPPPSGDLTSPLENFLGTRRYALEANPLNWKDLALTFDPQGLTLEVKDHRGTHRLTAGRGQWVEGVSSLLTAPMVLNPLAGPKPLVLVSSFAWTGSQTLSLVCRSIEEPFVRFLALTFEGGRVRVDQRLKVNIGPLEFRRIVGVARRR